MTCYPTQRLTSRLRPAFNRCNITTNEGGIIDEEYKVLYARDRTETTSAVWLALTTGCAVCHDHKFDPIHKKDFYSLSAFFNNTTQPVRDGNVANNPPIVVVPLPHERDRYKELGPLLAQSQQAVDQAKAEAKKAFDTEPQRVVAAEILAGLPSDGLAVQALLSEGNGNAVGVMVNGQLQVRTDNSPLEWAEGHIAPQALLISEKSNVQLQHVEVPFEFDTPFTYSAWIYLTKDNITGAVIAKMDVNTDYRGFDLYVEGGRVGGHLIHKWQENALKVTTQNALPKERWHHVTLTYDGKAKAEGLKIYVNGELRTDRQVTADKLSGTIKTEVPLRIGARSVATQASGTRVNDVRLYGRQLAADEVQRLAINTRVGYLAQLPRASLKPADLDDLFAYWLANFAPGYNESLAAHRALQGEEKAIRDRGTVAHVMQERNEEAEAFILERGEYDQRRDRVTAETPHSLPPMASDLPKNRLGLAKWLVSPEHPLTARVTVNRFWQEVFGTGLVATSGDFGISGQLPSHPELLDWLAVEFREKGWDVKQLIRSFVCSATYRQSAQTTEQKLAVDPANRLMSRGPRFRMDAEMVRDYALASAGLLSTKIGGPSVKPYQPDGVWEAVAMTPSNTRFYKRDSGESLYRRSMYTFWKRSAPPASMDIFNAPSRETCTVRRERTNTPLQALATLNDPQLIEAARHLAARAIESASDLELRIDFMAMRLLARKLEPNEREIIDGSLKSLLAHYQAQPNAANELLHVGESPVQDKLNPSELAAFTMLANELMNLDEVVTK